MKPQFTAVIKRTPNWWIGWVEEIPGANAQGETKEELMENLREALVDILELNREAALREAESDYIEEALVV